MTVDTIEEFTVDLQVQWWDALDDEGNVQMNPGDTEHQVVEKQQDSDILT